MIFCHLKHIRLSPIFVNKLVTWSISTEDSAMIFEITFAVYLVLLAVIGWEDLRRNDEFHLEA